MEPVQAAAAAAQGSAQLDPAQTRRLRGVARDFEAIFLQQLLGSMRTSTGGKTLLGGGQQVYQGMMDEELARAVSRGGGIGIADMLLRDMTRREIAQKKVSSPADQGPIEGRQDRFGASKGETK